MFDVLIFRRQLSSLVSYIEQGLSNQCCATSCSLRQLLGACWTLRPSLFSLVPQHGCVFTKRNFWNQARNLLPSLSIISQSWMMVSQTRWTCWKFIIVINYWFVRNWLIFSRVKLTTAILYFLMSFIKCLMQWNTQIYNRLSWLSLDSWQVQYNRSAEWWTDEGSSIVLRLRRRCIICLGSVQIVLGNKALVGGEIGVPVDRVED